MAENLKVEVIRCRGGPQTKRVDILPAVAHNGPITRGVPINVEGRRATAWRRPSRSSTRAIQLHLNLLMRALAFTGPDGSTSCQAVPAAIHLVWVCLKMPVFDT